MTSAPVVARAGGEVAARIERTKFEVLEAFGALEAMLSAARSSPEQQAAVVALVDSLVHKQRSLSPDEELCTDGLVGIDAAAELLGIGRTLVQKLISDGELRFAKIGTRVLIPRRALLRYAAERLSDERSK